MIPARTQVTVMIGTLLVLLVISICLLGVLFLSSPPAEQARQAPVEFGPVEVQDRTALQGNTETIIPASADGIHGVIHGSNGITTHMRFDIPSEALGEFMQTTGCDGTLDGEDIRVQFERNPQKEWWALDAAQTYSSCNGDTEHLAQLVFIDTTNPERYIVYVFTSTR